MVTKTQVAEYWAARKPAVFFVDLFEPACFACGYWQESWDSKPRPWEAARLQLCHLVPASLGSPDTADNIVVLCAGCHRDAPDHANPEWMIRWILAREDWLSSMARRIDTEVIGPLGLLGVTTEDIMRYLADPRFRDRMMHECTVQAGALSLATMAAAIAEHHSYPHGRPVAGAVSSY